MARQLLVNGPSFEPSGTPAAVTSDLRAEIASEFCAVLERRGGDAVPRFSSPAPHGSNHLDRPLATGNRPVL
jgi:hypothetical protein